MEQDLHCASGSDLPLRTVSLSFSLCGPRPVPLCRRPETVSLSLSLQASSKSFLKGLHSKSAILVPKWIAFLPAILFLHGIANPIRNPFAFLIIMCNGALFGICKVCLLDYFACLLDYSICFSECENTLKYRFHVFSVGSQNLNIMCQDQKS